MTSSSLKVHHFDKKIRLGVCRDGGYVLGELYGNNKPVYDCYISCGVGDEESFSKEFIEKYDMTEVNSFAYDGSISKYPDNYTKNISFVQKNIGPVNDENNTNLFQLIQRYEDIFLKMDIEGGEYPWILAIDEASLKKIKQIVIEFHGITNNGYGCNKQGKYKCLDKLSNTHFLIHAHGNNYGEVLDGIPDVIELTYINKKCYEIYPCLNSIPLPIPDLDFSNYCGYNDIDLNFRPFCY